MRAAPLKCEDPRPPLREDSSLRLKAVEGDAVAFGVGEEDAVAEGADGGFGFNEFSAGGGNGFGGGIEAAFDGQIDEGAAGGGLVVLGHGEAAGGLVVGVGQDGEFPAVVALQFDRRIEHGGVEVDGAGEIRDRDIGPAKDV
jgi:hypothetical protein